MADTALTPGRLTIDLAALVHNYRLFQSMTDARVAVAVKADGYGTGMIPVSRALIEAGCDTFFVATPQEGIDLRAINPFIRIGILCGLLPGAEEAYLEHQILPCISSLEMLARWSAFAKATDQNLPAILHFDTAMNRLGLGADEAQALRDDPSLLDNIDVLTVMSHFASSDEKDSPLNDLQAQRFADYAADFPDAEKSLANSSGLFRNKDWHHDLVRIGYALYGGNPTPETDSPVKQVAYLDIPVLQIRQVKKGETIGYNARHTFTKDTTTATLGFGYADGFLRSASNRAVLYWNGQPCPVVGRVSMDLVTIDLGGITGALPRPGDYIEVLGAHQSVDALAAACGTNGYEILTSLGPRYRRVYKT